MPGTNLTRDEAVTRAELVTVESYDIDLDVTTSETTFRSTSTIRFTAEPGRETFVDLIAPSVERITLNGADLDPATHFTDSRVRLPDLAADNTVTIEATCAFMNTGEGLHRFVDPVDGEVYLYSQFEVPNSRRMYAVFEQPDLKASFAFTVTAPAHWQVVSNSPTPEPEPVADHEGVATWRFAPTARISSYITALIAGPYDVARDSLTSRKGEIPLGIFCRRSLTQYLDADNLFDLTKIGFAFFEKEFDRAYPFEKYDQIFTPEYNAGAMENAGAVTFLETYIFRSRVPRATIERRALTLLHELAHMWFGNLVTMKWWNDLWLNESFAEWASTTCQAEATQWSHAWTTFGTHEKAWAYSVDQLSTTHPIVAPIRDLEDVEVNFDGITYAKGASVLKQLVAYVGRDAFRTAIRAYFDKHEWGNTTLADLLTELETASGRSLTDWSQKWLETAGVNTLRALLDVDDEGIILAARISQAHAPGLETLRPHRLAIGLYDVEETEGADDSTGAPAARLVRTDRIELDVFGASTPVPALVGRKQPDLLLVNDDDLTYAKIRLDERSVATALAHLGDFTDSLPRALVLASAWDMTRDAEVSARVFIDLALAALPDESDSTLIRTLIAQITLATQEYLAPGHAAEARAHVAATFLDQARTVSPGGDAQLQLITAYAGLLRAGDDGSVLRSVLAGHGYVPGLVVDADMRWTLLTGLAAVGEADADEIAAEQDRDNTATGHERAARALASRPTLEAKQAAWDRAVTGVGASNSIVEALGLGFGRPSDPSVLEAFVTPYHDMLETVHTKGSHAIMESIVRGFYPRALASTELHEATQRWLDSHTDAPAALARLVRENRDGVSRALAAQAFDAQARTTTAAG